MRTTIAIADELLAAARRRAQATGTTLGGVIEVALRRELAMGPTPRERPPVPVFSRGTGARPGLDLASNAALAEALDEGLRVEDRR